MNTHVFVHLTLPPVEDCSWFKKERKEKKKKKKKKQEKKLRGKGGRQSKIIISFNR